jgi:hypothetical protein
MRSHCRRRHGARKGARTRGLRHILPSLASISRMSEAAIAWRFRSRPVQEPAFLSCGAYKATHSSAALNGFVPLKVRCI